VSSHAFRLGSHCGGSRWRRSRVVVVAEEYFIGGSSDVEYQACRRAWRQTGCTAAEPTRAEGEMEDRPLGSEG